MNRALTALFLTVLLAALSGCASTWVVDSNVTTFSRIAAAPTPQAPLTYRFERLPSQQAQEASQRELEAMAAAAMAGVGLQLDEAAPRYSAQIAARVTVEYSPWVDPWFYGGAWGPGYYGYGRWGYPRGWYGGGWYGPYAPPPNPWYVREVSIVLRELPANQVVYETRAYNDGPYSANGAVLPVMFQAAMQGFPNPPQGTRRVDIPIPTAHN